MGRQFFRPGDNTYVRENGFFAEYLVSPLELTSNSSMNPSGALSGGSTSQSTTVKPIRISQFALYFTSDSGGTIRMRLADSSAGTDGYSDTVTKTARNEQRDFPNLAKFGGNSVYYGFSKGDTTNTKFYASGGGVIYARVGTTVSNRQMRAELMVDTVPSAVTGAQASVLSSSSVALRWNEPSDNGGIPISGYRVLKKVSGGNWEAATTTSGTTRQATITGLSASTSYTFAIAAYNNVSLAHGGTRSEPSYHTGHNDFVSATTPTDVEAPSATISAVELDQDSITVTWNSSSGNRAPTSVSVVRNDTGAEFSTLASGSQTFNGLSAGTSYTYTITVSNEAGSFTTDASATTDLPTPQLSITAVAIDSTSARVYWSSSDATSVSVSGTNLNSTELSDNVIVEDLQPGGIYSWAGTASNADGSVEVTSNRVQLPNVIGGVWDGADWKLPSVRRWGGSSWQDTDTFVWTGNEWKLWA